MDRVINYPGQVPLETDLLRTNQSVMVGLAKLSQAIFGTGGIATGFGTTQTVVPSLAVLVAPGEIYSQQNLEATAVSSLPQDLTHSIVKQGILLDAATLPVAPPGTAGFSINYLVQVAYQDSDTGSTVLPYYNASNPSVAYSGPANSGAAQPTMRQGLAVVSLKAGTAATTGTQTTPAPDAGKLGLYVVTIANGASTVVNANISAYAGAPILSKPLINGRFLGLRVISATSTFIPSQGATFGDVICQGAGGAGGGAVPTGAGQCSVGSGGAGGGWSRKIVSFVGVTSVAATIGAGGTGVTGGGGNTGGTTSFGAFCSAPGGTGGTVGGVQANTSTVPNGGAGSPLGIGGDVNGTGGFGQYGMYGPVPLGGGGGHSLFGGGAAPVTGTSGGNAAPSKGAGGSGGSLGAGSGTGAGGGAGGDGLILVAEYA